MDLAAIKVDSAKIEGGDWVGDLPGLGNLRLKVRGLGCMAYRLATEKRVRALPRSQRAKDGSIAPAAADKLAGEAMAEALLLDWENLTSGGKTVPYSRERAVELLSNPDYRDFRSAVQFAAAIVAANDEAHEEALLGNSETPSSGTSTGESAPVA